MIKPQPHIVKAMKPKNGKDWVLVRGDTAFVRFLATDDEHIFELQTPTRPEDSIRIGSGTRNGYKLPIDQKRLFSVAEQVAIEQDAQPEHKVDSFNNPCVCMGFTTIDKGKTIQDVVNDRWITRFFELFDAAGDCTSMTDSYSDLCVDDSEDEYLSDGMWKRPNGTMYER